jgi:hypothetical protein
VGLAARAPRVAPGDEHVQEAPGARRGHHPAAGGRVAAVALLHAAAALHGGRGHGRRRRGRASARAAVLLLLLVVVRVRGLVLPAALEPLQGRLHLLDRAHAVIRRRGAARGGGGRWCRCRCRRRRAGLRGGGHREQVQVPRRRRARALLLVHPRGLHVGAQTKKTTLASFLSSQQVQVIVIIDKRKLMQLLMS